jgi:hypothetical protein
MLLLSFISLVGMRRAKGGGAFLFPFSIALLCFAASFSAAQLRTFLEDAPMLDKRAGSMAIEGMVVSLKPHDKNRRIAL